jgi:hypothetical protein
MKRLLALGVDPSYLDRYEGIRDSKHLATRASLVAIHARVASQYDAYQAAADATQLESLQADAQCGLVRHVLRACYDIPTQALKLLKADIKAAQPARQLKYCPLCGITLPPTFDHYLPAARFPEFSVYALNLVPACFDCNSIKDDDWLNASGARQYLHAFTDPIPEAQFLRATLHQMAGLEGVGVTFDLARPAGIPGALWTLIESHFRRLSLIRRYNELGNDEIAEVLASCRSHLRAGGADARAFLQEQGVDRRDVYGRNHWRTVLIDALCVHANLEAWVEAMSD